MDILTMIATGAGVLAFGPGFLAQAAIGYVAGSIAGGYCGSRMKKLHCEICRHTGDRPSDIDELASMAAMASRIGGVICPVIPAVAVGVGIVCNARSEKLADCCCERKAVGNRGPDVARVPIPPAVGGIGGSRGGNVVRI